MKLYMRTHLDWWCVKKAFKKEVWQILIPERKNSQTTTWNDARCIV